MYRSKSSDFRLELVGNTCTRCENPLIEAEVSHGRDPHTRDHAGLCCDCFDLKWFPEGRDRLPSRQKP